MSADRFVAQCREAMETGRRDALLEHADGRSAFVRDVAREYGSGGRAQAIAQLTLALDPACDRRERAERLRAAIEGWLPETSERLAAPDALDVPRDVLDALWRICQRRRELRLAPLHDVALLLCGRPPRVRRRAAISVAAVSRGAGRLLILEARLLDGALPGIFEDPVTALADRSASWRAMEATVDDLVDRLSPSCAVRYTLRDNNSGAPWCERLEGASAGMALAVAAARTLQRRVRPLDPNAAITAAIDADGRAVRVEEINRKIAVAKPRGGEGDVQHLEPLRRLLVPREQAAQLAQDRIGVARRHERLAVVPDWLKVVPVSDLESALRRARRPLPSRPLAAAAVVLAALAAGAFAATRSSSDSGRQQRIADAALPAKIASATRRLAASDPDEASLLLAEQATVQPTAPAIAALFGAYRNGARRISTVHPSSDVSEMRLLADGTRLVTGGSDGAVAVWDTRSGRRVSQTQLGSATEAVRGLALSHDMRSVAVAGEGAVLVQGLAGSSPPSELYAEHAGGVSAVAFAPGDRTLYVGARNQLGVSRRAGDAFGPIRWETVTGEGYYVREVFPLDARDVAYCVEAPGGVQELHRLDLRSSRQAPIELPGGATAPCPAAQLADGGALALLVGPRTVSVGRVRGRRWLEVARSSLPEEVRVLRSVPGSPLVYVASQQRVDLLARDGRIVARARVGAHVTGVTVGRSGRTIALAAPDGSVAISPLRPPQTPGTTLPLPFATGSAADPAGAAAIAWSGDGRRIAVASRAGEVAVLDPRRPSAPPLTRTVFPGTLIRALALDRHGRVLWAGSQLGQVARVDLRDATAPIRYATLPNTVRDLALSPDGRMLAAAGFPGAGLTLLDPEGLGFSNDGKVDAISLAWVDPRRLLVATGIAGGSDQTHAAVRVFDPDLGRHGQLVTVRDPGLLALAAGPAARSGFVAGVGEDGTLLLFDVRGPNPRLVRSTRAGSALLASVAWSPDGRVLATAGTDDTLRLVDVATFEPIGQLPLDPGVDGARLAVHDGALASVATGQARVRLLPLGVRAWSEDLCARTARFLTPAEWVDTVGALPPYRTPCRRP